MMDGSAHVRSLDALREFRLALIKFRDESGQAMAAIEMEIQRAMDWLSHDRLKFWQQQIRVREDRVNEAKMDLHRCQLSTNADGTTPACDDQKKALSRAKRQLDEAHEKLELTKKWIQIVAQEISEYRGPAQQMMQLIEGSMPTATADFDQLVRSLEAYVQDMLAASGGSTFTPSAPSALPSTPPPK